MKGTQLIIAGLALMAAATVKAGSFRSTAYGQVPNYVDNTRAAMPAAGDESRARIQVALLLDTSNSMDGLIEQAKSRLWNIINTLTTLRYQGKEPVLEIALYEYGNSGLSDKGNWIRQVAPLTTDLDLISEMLFGLRTYGGEEYCGAVIRDAVRQLNWGINKADMKLVYIAGNEPFDQGSISYKTAINEARNKNIYINTIFCGDNGEGIRTHWKNGAETGKGKYFNINSDLKVRYIETPYDARIEDCNRRLNATYISYGSMGESKKRNQEVQDMNAASMSKGNAAERSIAKSKAAYKNESWDLVDRVSTDEKALEQLSGEDLPDELRGKSKAEIKKYVAAKEKERKDIQEEMSELAKQRQSYIDEEMKKSTGTEDDLGNAMVHSILDIASSNGYKVVNE